MADDVTWEQLERKERWCMADVEPGQEDWPKGLGWHPLPGKCKRRGAQLVDDEWRCGKHSRTPPQPTSQCAEAHRAA
ncbi:MAG: hypothetical protein JXB05_29190 [Myxococcaceae bacterium]|nr:hypothetical protein [Myxococcaceae bacterium]